MLRLPSRTKNYRRREIVRAKEIKAEYSARAIYNLMLIKIEQQNS